MSSIVTFYSYKGGVGRTMALANIAVLLAQEQQNVLIIDWDLEAPGLDRYFTRFGVDLNRPGLLDLLEDAESGKSEPFWRDYVSTIKIDGSTLTLMTSGRQDDSYAQRVLAFNWHQFFEQHNGGAFIESLRDDWKAKFDIVMVDSRTGYTDAGGVCTIQLPDIIAPVFTCTDQSLTGVKNVVLRAQAARQKLDVERAPLLVLPLASRFDGRSEFDESQAWLDRFAHELAPFYEAWLPVTTRSGRRSDLVRATLERTKLPYVAYFSFGEKLPVLEAGKDDPEGLGYAYRAAASLLKMELRSVERLSWLNVVESETPKPFGAPSRNPFFVGREADLTAVRDALATRGQRGYLALVVLQGLAGMGKTQIALEYAHRFRDSYDAVFWIDCGSTPMADVLLTIARTIEPNREHAENADLSQSVAPWLRANARKWLVVLDGGDARGYESLFSEPSGKLILQGDVLLTSRRRPSSSLSMRLITIGPLKHDEAKLLLVNRAERSEADPKEVAAASELVDTLGGHPLALDLAGAYIVSRHARLDTFLQSYRKRGIRLFDQQRASSDATLEETIGSALAEVKPYSLERNILIFSAMLASAMLVAQPIPLALLAKVAPLLLTEASSEVLDETDMLAVNDVLTPLVDLSLLSVNFNREEYIVHDLVAEVMLLQMPIDESAYWAAKTIEGIAYALPAAPYPVEPWRKVLAHAEAAVEMIGWVPTWRTEAPWLLLMRVGEYHTFFGHLSRAETLLTRALTFAQEGSNFDPPPGVGSRRHALEAVTSLALAGLELKRGEPIATQAALDQCERALNDASEFDLESVVGIVWQGSSLEPRIEVQRLRGELETAFKSRNAAIVWLSEALAGNEKIGLRTFGTAHALDALARFHLLSGNARPLAEKSLLIKDALCQRGDPDLAESLVLLAQIDLQIGKTADAWKRFSEALTIQNQVFADDHPAISRTKCGLSAVERELEVSESLVRSALAAQERVLGDRHPDVVESLIMLSRVSAAKQRDVEAEFAAQRALVTAVSVYGEYNWRIAPSLISLGDAKRASSQTGYAGIEEYQRALRLLEPEFGSDGSVVLAVRKRLPLPNDGEATHMSGDQAVRVLDSLHAALRHPGFRWRSMGRLAAIVGESEDTVESLLRSDPTVRVSRGRSGNVIAGLRERVGSARSR